MTLGQRIAFHRKKKSLTQQQLGEQLNISAQAISKWENDQTEPDVTALIRLSEIFEISINEIVKGESATVTAPRAASKSVTAKPAAKRSLSAKDIAQIALVLVITAVLAVATVLVLQSILLDPTSSFNYNRIELGMTPQEVEDILGAPQQYKKTKNLDGYVYERDSSGAGSFAESFLEGLTGESGQTVRATYYYYGGAYGRKLAKISKINQKINQTESLDKQISLAKKRDALEAELENMEGSPMLKIVFKNDEVIEVKLIED